MQQDPIAMPAFRAQDFRHLAAYESGSLVLAGAPQLGTAENPMILYVNGNLTIGGDTQVSGYGIVLVTGTVQVNDEVTTAVDGSTRLGIYANGDVSFNAPATVEAQVFSASDVIFGAPTALYGSVTAGDDVAIQSPGVEVHYRTASPALTEPFWPTSGQ
jgi:hypothetical protein